MKNKKLYWLLSIILLWTVCALIFNYFFNVEKESRIQQVSYHQKTHAQLSAKNFELLFQKWNKELEALSKDTDIILMNWHGRKELQNLYVVLQNELKGITRVDKSGRIIFSLPISSVAGKDISTQKHVSQILKTNQPLVSNVFQAVQGFKAVVVQYPVFKNNEFDGIISFVLDFEKVSRETLDLINISPWDRVLMLSKDGTELYCNYYDHIGKNISVTLKSHKGISTLVDSLLMGKEGVLKLSENKGNINTTINYLQPINLGNTYWYLAISYPENEIERSLVSFRNKLILIMAVLFFVGAILLFQGIRLWIYYRNKELKQIAEKKLKESAERYQTVIETTDTGYAVLNKDGKIIDSNQKFAQMIGFGSSTEITGKSIDSFLSDTFKRYGNNLSNILGKGPVQNLELEFEHPNNAIVPVEINANKISSEGKDLILMLCRDITERKQSREKLNQERALLRSLVDNLPSGIFIKDKQYRKIVVNKIHIQSILGHLKKEGWNSDVEIIGKTDFEVYPFEEAQKYFLEDQRVIEFGESLRNLVYPGHDTEGENIWLLISKLPLHSETGEVIGLIGITTDITEQKKVEEQLIIAKNKAEQSDLLKTSFLNNISHEIRTPLNAIIGFSELLLETETTPEKRKHFLHLISQSSNQLLLIITDIINIATIEAGQLKLNNGKVDVNSTLRILYDQFHGIAVNKKIEFRISLALSDQDAIIISDAIKFLEVLSNLINNAIKFTNQGQVSFGYELEANMLKIHVSDTGIGIKPEHHEKIFDRFWQVEHTLSNKYGGTGLGLSISKTYVELMGGKIWLHSEPGIGTSFYFTLPYTKT